jgi:lipopolysaccharide biosynthesis glycosyltransferase
MIEENSEEQLVTPIKVFVGYDHREDIAYQVCKYSIESRSHSVEVIPLNIKKLTAEGHYFRPDDEKGSTEFTFTRFLVPHLTDYTGWAVFCDCDVIWQVGIEDLMEQADPQYAVMVVQHEYTPTEQLKMDGKIQYPYPRKNWSSVILWNCDHPSNKMLTKDIVNEETGAFLHRFQWLPDSEIGALPTVYNWLVNWYHEPEDGKPKIIHYTEGGPWFDNYVNCAYGANWEREKNKYLEAVKPPAPEPIKHPFENLPPQLTSLFHNILRYRVDPAGDWYGEDYEKIIKEVKMLDNGTVFAVDGGRDPNDPKGHVYDPYMKSFIIGSGGQITNYDKIESSMTPVVFRGITKSKHMRACEAKGRDYYYIDTGYFGNVRKKFYHRITKNAMQNIGPVIERPFDRLALIGWQKRKFRPGRNILICPPSSKAMENFGLDLKEWIENTVNTIKANTDRPIVIREKLSRRERSSTDTMEMALERDVHCLVTYNSIAATEAVLLGKPAFTLGPNAAHSVSSNDLTQIDTPYYPTLDEVEAWAAHLAYAQFSEAEMMNGTAWRILNDHA